MQIFRRKIILQLRLRDEKEEKLLKEWAVILSYWQNTHKCFQKLLHHCRWQHNDQQWKNFESFYIEAHRPSQKDNRWNRCLAPSVSAWQALSIFVSCARIHCINSESLQRVRWERVQQSLIILERWVSMACHLDDTDDTKLPQRPLKILVEAW